MRKLLTSLVLFVFIAILLKSSFISGAKHPQKTPSKSSSETSAEGPRVHFLETSWDFGKIPLNSGVSHAYWIKNVGTDTLKILKVRPG
jgi:hypothetical protein